MRDPVTGSISHSIEVEFERLRSLRGLILDDEWRVIHEGRSLPIESSRLSAVLRVLGKESEYKFKGAIVREKSIFDDLPYKIHTGRELRMMLLGVKPLAYFSTFMNKYHDDFDITQQHFDYYVKRGIILRHQRTSLVPNQDEESFFHLAYTLPSDAWRAEAIFDLMDSIYKDGWNDFKERLQGELLGYTDWENDTYMKWRAQCCSQIDLRGR